MSVNSYGYPNRSQEMEKATKYGGWKSEQRQISHISFIKRWKIPPAIVSKYNVSLENQVYFKKACKSTLKTAANDEQLDGINKTFKQNTYV